MTLKFEVKLPTTWTFITRLVIMMPSRSWYLFWHFWGQGSQKNWMNHVTLTVDLQNWGHKYTLHMTFRISGCMYSKDKISVSILTFSRSRISKKQNQLPNLDSWPWTSRSNLLFLLLYDLSYLWLYTWYKLDLGVDSNFLEVKDLE